MSSSFANIISQLSIYVPLTREEGEMITGYLTIRLIRKRQFLVAKGEHCRAGSFRAFYVDEK